MSNRLSGLSSLGYQGTNATMPPNIFYYPRNPTPLDWQNFSIGDIWINKLTEVIYMLVSLQGNVATWQTLTAGSSELIALTGNNTGVSVPPTAGVIHIVGDGTLLNFTGNAGTSTITGAIGGSVLTSIITDSGTVTPVGHTMSLLGGNNISITASGDTATVSLSQGTDGQVLIGSSSGLPMWRNLTAGSNVTITNGSNSIEIASSGGGGGSGSWILLSTQTATAQPALNFTSVISGTYNNYFLIYDNATFGPTSVSAGLIVQLSTNNGASYITTGYRDTAVATTGFRLVGNGNPTFVLVVNGCAWLYNMTSGIGYVSEGGNANVIYNATTSSVATTTLVGFYGTSIVSNALRIVVTDGSNFSGTFSLYGLIP